MSMNLDRFISECGGLRVEPSHRLELRDYQEEALAAWVSGGCKGVIVMPTGAGKSYVALAAIRDYSKKVSAVVVPTVELARQWREKVTKHLGIVPAIVNGGRWLPSRIVITTYHSAAKVFQRLGDSIDLVVFDECHHLRAKTWSKLLELAEEAGAKIMGLTATYERNGLEVNYAGKLADYVKKGYVSDVEYTHVIVPSSKSDRVSQILASIDRLKRRLGQVPEDSEEFEEIMVRLAALHQTLRIELETTEEKLEALKLILEAEKPRGIKGVVFVETIKATERVTEKLREWGYEAQAYHSRLDKEERRKRLAALRDRDMLLVAAKALDEGIDVPSIKLVIILSCPKKPRRMIQRIGRGLRAGDRLRLYTVTTTVGETREAGHLGLAPRRFFLHELRKLVR